MSTEVRPTPIAGLLELVAQPFSDHRGVFFNAFRTQETRLRRGLGRSCHRPGELQPH